MASAREELRRMRAEASDVDVPQAESRGLKCVSIPVAHSSNPGGAAFNFGRVEWESKLG